MVTRTLPSPECILSWQEAALLVRSQETEPWRPVVAWGRSAMQVVPVILAADGRLALCVPGGRDAEFVLRWAFGGGVA